MAGGRRLTIRRLVLAGSGLTFLAIATCALFMPQAIAQNYGLALNGLDGLNEFRAIFSGFWAGIAIALFTAAFRQDVPLIANLCAVMILLQAVGRAVSFTIDGIPSWRFVAAFVFELTAGMAILLTGPSNLRSPGPSTPLAP